ncbi:MAG: hypothetical protein AAGC85_17130 [Bacteroidota bacterium]
MSSSIISILTLDLLSVYTFSSMMGMLVAAGILVLYQIFMTGRMMRVTLNSIDKKFGFNSLWYFSCGMAVAVLGIAGYAGVNTFQHLHEFLVESMSLA